MVFRDVFRIVGDEARKVVLVCLACQRVFRRNQYILEQAWLCGRYIGEPAGGYQHQQSMLARRLLQAGALIPTHNASSVTFQMVWRAVYVSWIEQFLVVERR